MAQTDRPSSRLHSKKISWLGCRFFVSDVISEVVLAYFGSCAQPLGQSVSLKFSFETRLESESFEPLIDFVAFFVHKFDLK